MVNIRYSVCDKCGCETPSDSGECSIVESSRIKYKFRIVQKLGFGPYNYIDHHYELCKKCGKDVLDFIEKEG